MGYAVPHSIKLQAEYGDDLAVLFVEVQGTPNDKTEAFALKRKWLGGGAMWTNESPFRLDIRGIPQFALLSPDGEIVLSGHNSALQGEMEDAIEDMVKSLAKGPEELPKKVRKAWGEMGKGNYAKALTEAEKIIADGKSTEDTEAAQKLVEAVNARVASRVSRIGWMLDNGFPLDAKDQIGELKKAAGDHFDVAEDLAAFTEKLESDEFASEVKAAKGLAKIEKKLFEDPDAKYLKKLDKLIEDYAGTKVAARAKKLRSMTELATS